jgi:cysteinyl-tRNA synthetase
MTLQLHNTLTGKKEPFRPLDASHVRIYACGPTVYDRIHVGNARPLVVFDVLVRLLRHHFKQVTYVRNITDLDDKINARAAEEGTTIDQLCQSTIASFHEDAAALGVLPPDIEPRATHHIDQMIAMIGQLIARGHAYEAGGHVLFSVPSQPNYGQLSGRSRDEQIAGARVEVAPYKQDPADFVLWKPSTGKQPGWDSPWGVGRPGWHIECSAMSAEYLGQVFDIHAGGLDLVFPHHENEMAQSCAAHGTEVMAGYWLHNGYVTVEGEKMSKSLGNFVTVADSLQDYAGEVVRYALLSAHYRAPLDYAGARLAEAETALDRLYAAAGKTAGKTAGKGAPDAGFLAALADDLNTPQALSVLHGLARQANKGDSEAAARLQASAALLGLLEGRQEGNKTLPDGLSEAEIEQQIEARSAARKAGDFAVADAIRDALAEKGIELTDSPQGTGWRNRRK